MRWFAFLFFVGLVGCQPETREKIGEAPTGYRGKARINPYLAAETYLAEKGWEVESSRTWSNYRYETDVIFMPGSFLQTKGMGIRVLEWIGDGGTLVLTVEGGEPERNDFTDFSSGSGAPEKGDFTGLDYLFETVGIEVSEDFTFEGPEEPLAEDGHLSREWELVRTEESEGGYELEFEGNVSLSVKTGWYWTPKIEGQSRVIETSYGAGEIIVLAHARPLRNPYLARADHAKFLEYIVDTYADGNIVFLYGSSTSFFGLIWKEGRMAVIAGLVLLGAWLWMRIPRFGPVLQDSEIKRSPYGESLKASARFLWRGGQLEHLLRPLRARLEKENQGDPTTLYDRLAEESGLNREEVAEALTINPPKDPGHILKVVQKLQALLKR